MFECMVRTVVFFIFSASTKAKDHKKFISVDAGVALPVITSTDAE